MMNYVTNLLRQTVVGLSVLIGLTVVLGGVYPAAVWAVSRVNAQSADGAALTDRAGCVVGSERLGIDPQVPAGTPDPYLHARVVGADTNPMAPGDASASGGSNLGPSSSDLAEQVTARRSAIAAREGVAADAVPADAVTASASGLDPNISPAYAQIQIPRIARVTGKSPNQVADIINANTTGRGIGFLGQRSVNVLKVNIALGLSAPACPTR